MMSEQEIQGSAVEWADHTVLHPVGLGLVLACGAILLVLPRRYSVWPFLVVACFVAPAQRIYVFGLNFDLLRVMVLFGWVRILSRNEAAVVRWKPLDTVMVVWAIVSVFSYTFLFGTVQAFVNRLGVTFDAIGMYFVFRCLVREWCDLESTVFGFIAVSVPVAIFFLVESNTGRNLFAVFGGVPLETVVRDGRLRCQGAFAHPILAGCFWAAAMPMMAALWWKGARERPWSIAGLACACLVVVACASSTPVMAVLLSIIGAGFFRLRRKMWFVRWGVVVTLLGLHLIMKNPVWHLLCRVNIVGGSTGWHRFQVIDQAVGHFGEWWLIGTQSIAHWGVYSSDVTNQFVLEGITGGVAKLGLFVMIIVLAFASIGRIWRCEQANPYRMYMSWALGVALCVHCMNFIGVSYFGQITMIWYLQLAAIASLDCLASKRASIVGRRAARAASYVPAFHRVPHGN